MDERMNERSNNEKSDRAMMKQENVELRSHNRVIL